LKSLNDFVGALLEKLRHLNGVATLLKATPQRSLHLRLVSPGWANLDAFIIRELILIDFAADRIRLCCCV
jgi:hypothetical protein